MARAYEMPVKAMTIVPAADLTAKRYRFVTVNSDGKGILATAGANVVGVIQEPANIDEPANTMFAGISFVVFDGTVAAGGVVEVGTDGKAKALATGVAVGIALVGGADGEIGCALLK